MIAASIDIGTNTTLALLAESDRNGLKPLRDQLTSNRLGETLRPDGTLPADIIALNVDLLGEIARDFRREGAEEFALAGTSALRRAQNREQFISAVRDILGFQVEVIGGRDEAALTYLGAVSNRELFPQERVCVMDLGGGSTEIVEGHGYLPGEGYSIDVGSSYLTKEFFTNNPPTAVETATLRKNLRDRLPGLVANLRGAKIPWILVGGTAVTLAIFKAGLRRYDPEKIGGSTLTIDDIEGLIGQFTGKSADELQVRPGMPIGRGKTILAGSILLEEMFRALEITEGTVSERGLRHGLWLTRFGERQEG
jgi:exopolyphosphatase/guanosine-5'-triphosphate,3'-diphosphate pyrophosphatase